MIRHPPLFIKLAYDPDTSKSPNAHYNPENEASLYSLQSRKWLSV